MFTGRGPLCLHYREAINRKSQPKGVKTTVGRGGVMCGGGGAGSNLSVFWPLIK